MEGRRRTVRYCHILDDVNTRLATGMQRMIHDTGVHEAVKYEAGDAVEGCDEISEGITPDPKDAAIVAEEVVDERNVLSYGRAQSLHPTLSVKVEPGVAPPGELLYVGVRRDS